MRDIVEDSEGWRREYMCYNALSVREKKSVMRDMIYVRLNQ